MFVFSAYKFLSRLEQEKRHFSEDEYKEFVEAVVVNCDMKEARPVRGHDVAFVTGEDGFSYIVDVSDCEYVTESPYRELFETYGFN